MELIHSLLHQILFQLWQQQVLAGQIETINYVLGITKAYTTRVAAAALLRQNLQIKLETCLEKEEKNLELLPLEKEDAVGSDGVFCSAKL